MLLNAKIGDPEKLRRFEQALPSLMGLQATEAAQAFLPAAYEWLDGIHESNDGYTGDPIGGWAGRLRDEVYVLMR